tara:strand:+ start:1406 stop:2245 length:840 start_codon:yes stop_codon:yes gene_type:complete
MKCLIIGNFHHKNKIGLELLLKHLNYNYKFGNINDIPQYDLIFMPTHPVNTSNYPNKKFIFGNHFSVFPTNKLSLINNIYKNSVYIQPSKWVCELWKPAEKFVPIKILPFPVEIKKFKPNNKKRTKVFIYFKYRMEKELNFIKSFLQNKNIEFRIFDYKKKYPQDEYIKYLQESKYGIWLGAHESQGFALEEALAINVPLLVWNVKYMSQEVRSNYEDIFATTIPYFDKSCGEYFYKESEFSNKYSEFISKLNTYNPRKFILNNLNVKQCADKLLDIIN